MDLIIAFIVQVTVTTLLRLLRPERTEKEYSEVVRALAGGGLFYALTNVELATAVGYLASVCYGLAIDKWWVGFAVIAFRHLVIRTFVWFTVLRHLP